MRNLGYNPPQRVDAAEDARIPSVDVAAGIAGLSAALPAVRSDNAALTNTRTPTPYSAFAINEIVQAATDVLTAAEVSGTIVNNYGQGQANTQTLPAAAKGLTALFIIATAGAGAFNVKAGAGDKIYLDGTALDDGDKVACATPVVGNCAQVVAFQTGAAAYDWYCNTINGVWTDGGA